MGNRRTIPHNKRQRMLRHTPSPHFPALLRHTPSPHFPALVAIRPASSYPPAPPSFHLHRPAFASSPHLPISSTPFFLPS